MSIEPVPESPHDPVQDETGHQSRIEELLLEGLDHYFAARYEHAITVWTRVAFLERGHGRARAYIDRARSAQAEQQRQAEELVHAGVAAYHAGELDAARDLLTRAVSEGGPHETALAYLQRLGRADTGTASSRLASQTLQRPRGENPAASVAKPTNWPLTVAASAALIVAILVASLPIRALVGSGPALDSTSEATLPALPLPVASQSARALTRARVLAGAGRRHGALDALRTIAATDVERPEADALTAAIQRELLARAASSETPPRTEFKTSSEASPQTGEHAERAAPPR
jgi:hypothetical protein